MSTYTSFDEKDVCLNCPRKHCILERRANGVCSIIKERRETFCREQRERRIKKA